MKLLKFMHERFPPADNSRAAGAEARRQLARAMSTTTANVDNWISQGRDVEELADGRWQLVDSRTKYILLDIEP